MRLFLITFLAAFGGAFAGVAASRAAGAWLVRLAFNRMRADVLRPSAGAVPLVSDEESDCG